MNKEQKSEIDQEKNRQELLKKLSENTVSKKPMDVKAFLESKGLKVRLHDKETNS